MKIKELLERVEGLSGPDREVDAAIIKALGFHSWAGRMSYRDADGVRMWDFGSSEITASIDAAIALVERKLPGWAWKVIREEGYNGCVIRNAPKLEIVAPSVSCHGPTLPLAIISALLRALLAKGE